MIVLQRFYMDTVRQTVAIMAVSGIQLSLETVELLCRVRDKEITYDEAVEIIKEKVKERE
jgi:hypothetical protein